MIIDTHAHLTDRKYTEDRTQIIDRINKNNIIVINNATYIEDSVKSVNLAEKNRNIYSTFGVHPLDIDKNIDFSFFTEYLKHPKVIAVGEIGLDYHYFSDNKKKQTEIFEKQLAIAKEYNLPAVIHARDAVNDTIDIIRNYETKGVFHCFSGDKNELKHILDMGYYIGFDGPITFKNNINLTELLQYCPIDRIFCETDSPYLTPIPYRGKRNEPLYVSLIYDKIAEIKNINITEFQDIIYNNVTGLFEKLNI